MTKDQEAIEIVYKYLNFNKICGTRNFKDALEIVLSMLEEKDKKINSNNGTINALQCALKERTEERDRKDDIISNQNKIIDLMAEQLAGLTIWNNEKEEPLILGDKEEIKQYFERKATNNG